MKTQPEERSYTPLRETNLNVEPYGYSYDRKGRNKTKGDFYQRDTENSFYEERKDQYAYGRQRDNFYF